MMLDDRLFEQEWTQNLSNEDFRLLMYLFFFATKSGVVELNMRMINFVSNTGKSYTKEDVLDKFGNLLKLIPGKDNTAIFPDWIDVNWAKGKPIDPERNPLFKSIVNELGSFGLTIDDVNKMAKRKVEVKGKGVCDAGAVAYLDTVLDTGRDVGREKMKAVPSGDDVRAMFDAFWAEYPRECPRKTDKKKCLEKFSRRILRAKDPVQMFNVIMNGLERWKRCDTWTRNGGAFIMAPARWLNNENWNDTPMEGGARGNTNGNHSANANYQSSEAVGVF